MRKILPLIALIQTTSVANVFCPIQSSPIGIVITTQYDPVSIGRDVWRRIARGCQRGRKLSKWAKQRSSHSNELLLYLVKSDAFMGISRNPAKAFRRLEYGTYHQPYHQPWSFLSIICALRICWAKPRSSRFLNPSFGVIGAWILSCMQFVLHAGQLGVFFWTILLSQNSGRTVNG